MVRLAFIIVITAIGVGAAFFVDAFYGLLLYVFYTFASPLELTWGRLEETRLSFMVAGLLVTSALIQKQKIIIKHSIVFFSILFLFFCYISLAVREDASFVEWNFFETLMRILAIAIIASALLNSPERLRLYIFAVAFCIGLLDAYYGFGGLLAGSTNITGPGRVGDNNVFAVWINTSLPFIYYTGLHLKKLSWRYFSKVIFAGNMIAVMLTFSRGGFVALLTVLALILINIRRKILLFFLLAAAACALLLIPVEYRTYDTQENIEPKDPRATSMVETTIEQYRQRLNTLKQPKEEIDSAVSRIHFWKTAIDMANANFMFGVGLNRYQSEYDNYDNSNGKYGPWREIHNTILSILAETGYTGFFIFILLIAMVLRAISRTRRAMKNYPDSKLEKEFSDYCTMLHISMIAFFLGSFFVNALCLEIFWAIITVAIALDRISQNIVKGQIISREKTVGHLSQIVFGR